ncbi:hypothetical protein MKW98_021500 [Papaver atlanticum]|uniref:Uncharacterized protein n=1 Tax=Papaver atlanticum TaxID=357466 RepID=A0AAD4XKA9_9MAGN|nr:hypothetical protein MKW98_021500 [Papaver atlanticum]
MYATRHLSLCRKDPSILQTHPQESSSSGYIVITDEESAAEDTCCWGTCNDNDVREFPFATNKIVSTVYASAGGDRFQTDRVWFLPVLDQPLSSNRYYVITALGKHTGQACTCSKEEDMSTCCFCKAPNDVKPRVLDHRDIYQQVEVSKTSRGYTAESVAPDGFPPSFLRKRGWRIRTATTFHCQLADALGLNVSIRKRLPPEPNISSKVSTPVVVGEWYCPFVFIIEGLPKEQMKNSLFYKMTLDQSWEEIYTCENHNSAGGSVSVNKTLQKEAIGLFGDEAEKDDAQDGDGFVWYRHVKPNNKEGSKLGLSAEIVEKMKWVQQRGGYEIEGENRDVTVERVEKFGGGYEWRRFSFFVLVERFALRRMDGSLVLTCDYKHIHQTRSKWD